MMSLRLFIGKSIQKLYDATLHALIKFLNDTLLNAVIEASVQ